MNNGYLAKYAMNDVMTGISMNAMLVQVSANLDRLLPSVMADVMLTERGSAEIRSLHIKRLTVCLSLSLA